MTMYSIDCEEPKIKKSNEIHSLENFSYFITKDFIHHHQDLIYYHKFEENDVSSS